MADGSLSTPGAVSRRSLLSVAASIPVASAAAGASLPSRVPQPVFALLDRYRDTGLRLRETEAARARTLLSIPESLRPGPTGTGTVTGWPEWTPEEMAALGLPPTMSRRPSQAELTRHFRQSLHPDPAKQRETKRLHKARIEALQKRCDLQKEWYGRTGLDDLNRRRARLLEEKRGIERDLMALMIGPGRAATDA